MNKASNKQNIAVYLNGVLILGCIGMLLIGVSSTLLAMYPAAYYNVTLRTELGQVSDKVTATHPIHNVSFRIYGTAQVEIEFFTTNETPVTLRIYTYNLSFSYTLAHQSSNLTEYEGLHIDAQHNVTIEVHRETSNALFTYWVNMYQHIPLVANTLPVRLSYYSILLLAIGTFILITSLALLRQGLRKT
ncbi:MAG: hypothetical protein ACFFCH_11395 [Promethearchaeota archaeon]